MRILVLQASPNTHGSTSILVEEFCKGAREAGHNVERVDVCDMLVFATPLYYYGMTAQLKTVIDRFCSANSSITSRRLRSALLTVAWNADDWTFEALVAHYHTLVRYLSLRDCGMVLGYGCGTTSMTRVSQYPRKAYELGRSL